MSRELLLQHFDRISDSPDAVLRLREFALELAVRGKLVHQDSSEEPASSLLVSIHDRLLELGHRNNNPGILDSDDQPFALPSGWLWTRLGDICSKTGSGSTPRGGKSVYQAEGIPFLRSQNVYDDGLRLDDVAYITAQTHERMSGTALQHADMLLNITGGSIGRCCRVSPNLGPANVSQHVAIIRVAIESIQPYLHCLVRSPYFQRFIIGEQTGAGRGGLPKNRMDQIPVALPPSDEQSRIVAKVDELMRLCDRLEESKDKREKRRNALVAASLDKLSKSAKPESFRESARFYFTHLPRLTATTEHVGQLRQTILDLAIHGRLTHNSVRASKRDTRHHSRLSVGELTLPAHWKSQPLKEVAAAIVDCPHSTPKWTTVGRICVRTNQFRPGRLDLSDVRFVSEDTYRERIVRLEPAEDDILYSREGGILGVACRVPPNTPLCLGQRMMLIRSGLTVDPVFLEMVLNSPRITRIARSETTGAAAPRVNVSTVKAYPIPVPPLEEQRLIVSIVNELMVLCDRLDATLLGAITLNAQFLKSILHEALGNSSRQTTVAI